MGEYFGKFKNELSAQISVNLDKPIETASIAKSGKGIHRTIHELKSLTKWPQIIIYQGGSEEFLEPKFLDSEMSLIKKNFSLFQDDRIETLLFLYPEISRLLYHPIKKIYLSKEVSPTPPYEEKNYLNRLELELKLFEQHLIELINLSRDRNALIILTTTPFNLDISPQKTCSISTSDIIENKILEIREELKLKNPKSAYQKSKTLLSSSIGNASVYYLHGQIAKRLGKMEEAIEYLIKSSIYDCHPWRSNEVMNSIIRKVAQDERVLLFDFAQLLERNYNHNITFFDEIYPQSLYYEQGIKQLALVIKSILKL